MTEQEEQVIQQPEKTRARKFEQAWPAVARGLGAAIGVGNFVGGLMGLIDSTAEAYGFAALLIATPWASGK